MIRVVLGSALALVGLGAAIASFGPNLLAGPRGEPLVMVTPNDSGFQAASFSDQSCGSALLLATPDDLGLPSFRSEIMALTLSLNDDSLAVVIGDLSSETGTSEAVVLVFDDAGRLVSADAAATDVAIGDCLAEPDARQAPI